MKKFEEVVHEELQKSEVFFEEYNGNFILSDEKGVLLRKNGRLIIFPWLKFARDWVSPEDYQNTVASNKAFEKSNLVLSEENAKFVVENIELQKQITELKSQLEKQQPEIPEVPQFVVDWYEENKGSLDYMIFETCRDLTDESTDEFENWFGNDKNKSITTLVNMKNGYTVKEKRFYLKHIDMSKADKAYDWYITKFNKGLAHEAHYKKRVPEGLRFKFTQQEIDSMETGSYEQIEVVK